MVSLFLFIFFLYYSQDELLTHKFLPFASLPTNPKWLPMSTLCLSMFVLPNLASSPSYQICF